ncbi:uncharacterized protein A1O9_06972 [Exophiala aquamarina CBS 119918]|uniref:Uncharacterized protein n=1 Tax=Exophiala aquamarina CBS 119918 TaxID=1182545 RepID=A0A072PAM7_9EURO|nr:uncharacterized protein A1O9_06972 [Exophiala aquamarina CBS 119918]KEF56782.1 hypothetical protein A1O9_06972 [Exophiala aquamarina CBS 119918]
MDSANNKFETLSYPNIIPQTFLFNLKPRHEPKQEPSGFGTPPLRVRVCAQRIESLRNQLRFPHAIADSTLRWHLNYNNWELNCAAQSFWESEEATQAEAPTQRPARTVEQGRIFRIVDGADLMETTQRSRTQLIHNQPLRAAGQPPRHVPPHAESMSKAETGIPLHDREWILESLQGDLMGIIAAQVGTDNNLWLCPKFLVRHHYDLVIAVEEWMKTGGIPLVPAPLRRRSRKSIFRYSGVHPTNVKNPQRAINGAFKTFSTDPQPGALSQEDRVAVRRHSQRQLQRRMQNPAILRASGFQDYFKGARRGYLLNNRGLKNTPAYVASSDASKLWLEFVRDDGALNAQRFPSKFWIPTGRGKKQAAPFRWHDSHEPAQLHVEFDRFKSAHITRLNKWRAHRQASITSAGKKPNPLPFNKFELEWLTAQDAMNIEEQFYHEAGQDAQDSGIKNQGK